MKFLFALFMFFPLTAQALIGGKEDRDPNGFRKHVVTVRSNSGSGFCTGIVLNKKLILTAAHCFRTGGGYNVGFLNPAFLTQRINILNISLHPEWNPAAKLDKNVLHDIALIHLSTELPATILPVGLPQTPPKKLDPVNLVGFGLTNATNPDSSLMLHNLAMFVEEVNAPRQDINFSPYNGLPKRPGNGSCKGDSGGPALRLDSTQKYEVLGISSWASGPKDKGSCGIRSVYTDVYAHKDWIIKKAAEWKITF